MLSLLPATKTLFKRNECIHIIIMSMNLCSPVANIFQIRISAFKLKNNKSLKTSKFRENKCKSEKVVSEKVDFQWQISNSKGK